MKILLASLVVSLAAAAAAAGQQSDGLQDPAGASTRPPAAGWSLTPTILVSRTFDDNVLLHGPGDPLERDYINVINPRAEANYHGRLSDVSFLYDGAIIMYNRLDTLNSYE